MPRKDNLARKLTPEVPSGRKEHMRPHAPRGGFPPPQPKRLHEPKVIVNEEKIEKDKALRKIREKISGVDAEPSEENEHVLMEKIKTLKSLSDRFDDSDITDDDTWTYIKYPERVYVTARDALRELGQGVFHALDDLDVPEKFVVALAEYNRAVRTRDMKNIPKKEQALRTFARALGIEDAPAIHNEIVRPNGVRRLENPFA